MKNILTIFSLLLVSSAVFGAQLSSWECSYVAEQMGIELTKIRLQNEGGSYSAYVTAYSGDVGPQWELKDEKIAAGLSCHFSESTFAAFCSFKKSDMSEWSTLRSEKVTVVLVSDSGAERVHEYTNVILSGSNPVLKQFPNGLFRLKADNCKKLEI